jgi:hypothetical protein
MPQCQCGLAPCLHTGHCETRLKGALLIRFGLLPRGRDAQYVQRGSGQCHCHISMCDMSLGSIKTFKLVLSLASRRNRFPLRARVVATTEVLLDSKACYRNVGTKPLLVPWETRVFSFRVLAVSNIGR